MNAVRRTGLFVALSFVMGAAIYLAFDKFFTSDTPSYAVNISAAFLGAVITIIITAVLLNAQSLSELGKEKSIGVFNAKLALYSEFLDLINRVTRDGDIDSDELIELRGWALKLSLVSGSNATEAISSFIDQTLHFRGFRWASLDEAQKTKWFEWYKAINGNEPIVDDDDNYSYYTVGKIIMELKIDLGEENVSGQTDAAENSFVIDEMMGRL